MNSENPHDPSADASGPTQANADGQTVGLGRSCDFCNDVVPTVRRVALDGDYERLRTRHQEKYACPSCFDRKEKGRLGI